ncbi:hypothetical protein Oscil6304_0146 [Oscillatoria acuminata PCC 6304]|uniref:Uncharacterized protein n=1 Tax=Oscillatoria acuminata PCC 6304 TaxID=56110 RepID=K9TCQ0_9CYAN|nr:hypothetical protein Oscil6304_0146 [Oscillatoria acuminata PCC 6304]
MSRKQNGFNPNILVEEYGKGPVLFLFQWSIILIIRTFVVTPSGVALSYQTLQVFKDFELFATPPASRTLVGFFDLTICYPSGLFN